MLISVEDWMIKIKVFALFFMQECTHTSAIKSKDAYQVSPVKLKIRRIKHICITLVVNKPIDLIHSVAVVNTLQQQKVSDVRPHHFDLIDVFKLSLSF